MWNYVADTRTLTLISPSLQKNTANVVVQQRIRKLLKMGILMPETFWVSVYLNIFPKLSSLSPQ